MDGATSNEGCLQLLADYCRDHHLALFITDKPLAAQLETFLRVQILAVYGTEVLHWRPAWYHWGIWRIAHKLKQLGDRLYNSSAVAEMRDRGHNRHGQKEGAAVPLSRTAGTTSNTMWPSCAEVYFRTKWRVHPSSHLAIIDMGQKWLGLVCLFQEVARSASNTKLPEPRPTSIPSGILVNPAV